MFAVMLSVTSNAVFADHPQVDVSITPEANVVGCENANTCLLSSEISVDVGSEVIWTNNTTGTVITSGNVVDGHDGIFDSGIIGPGNSFTFKFEESGKYDYFSMIHPWIDGVILVEDDHGDDDGMMMHPEGDATVTGMLSDGTMVSIWASTPTSGEMMEISIEFEDSEHVNHDIMVTQDGEEVLNDEAAHHHDGKGMYTTAPLSSSEPVDITITFQGYGIDDPKTGPIGEEVAFSNVVPEFGTIAMTILAVATISIVAVTAKSRAIPRF